MGEGRLFFKEDNRKYSLPMIKFELSNYIFLTILKSLILKEFLM